MNELVIVSEEENEKMMDIVEEIDALKVLIQTLAAENDLYQKESVLYERIKADLKQSLNKYNTAWHSLIIKYQLDLEKADNYILDFGNRSIHYAE